MKHAHLVVDTSPNTRSLRMFDLHAELIAFAAVFEAVLIARANVATQHPIELSLSQQAIPIFFLLFKILLDPRCVSPRLHGLMGVLFIYLFIAAGSKQSVRVALTHTDLVSPTARPERG